MGIGCQVGDIVGVVWEDAWTDVAEHIKSDFVDECLFVTYGLVVDLTPDLIRISQDVRVADNVLRSTTSIPISLVREVTTFAPDTTSDPRDGSEPASSGCCNRAEQADAPEAGEAAEQSCYCPGR